MEPRYKIGRRPDPTAEPITIRQVTRPSGEIGWEAVTIGDDTIAHTTSLYRTVGEAVRGIQQIMALGMLSQRTIRIVP
jgi:hypothetical protein